VKTDCLYFPDVSSPHKNPWADVKAVDVHEFAFMKTPYMHEQLRRFQNHLYACMPCGEAINEDLDITMSQLKAECGGLGLLYDEFGQ